MPRLVAEETMRNYQGFMRSLRIRSDVKLLHEDTVAQARPLVHTLLIAVATVLLIACANLAGLLLVRSIRRRREIAVRLALGARAAMLLRQAMVESLVLSIAGGLVGLAFAAACIRIGISLLPETLPRIHEISLDWPVVAFALGAGRFDRSSLRISACIRSHTDQRKRDTEGGWKNRHAG